MLFKEAAFSGEILLYEYTSGILNNGLSKAAGLRSLQAVEAIMPTAASVPFATYLLIKVSHRPALQPVCSKYMLLDVVMNARGPKTFTCS